MEYTRITYGSKEWKKQRKEQCVEYMGGKCSACGYNKCIEALEFHHIKKKSYTVSHMIKGGYSIDSIIKELDNCIMLCANCHRERHVLSNVVH